jgi:hypothetical protein
MPVTLMLYLFGKPGVELGEGEEVTPGQLRALAADLSARLREAADITEKLTAKGWEAEMTLYDIFFTHPYVETTVQAEAMLQDLGIEPYQVHIEWLEDEDELEDQLEDELGEELSDEGPEEGPEERPAN